MKKYKAIILVIASQDEDVKNTRYLTQRLIPEWVPMYPTFKKVWESYMYDNENIKVLFVYGGGEKFFEVKDHDLIFEEVFENNYPGIIHKTILAMKKVDEEYDYDFLIRTNLSSFWDFSALEKRLDELPKRNFVSGTPVRIRDKEQNEYFYYSGFDLICSRDQVTAIAPHVEELKHSKVFSDLEDLILCEAFNKYGGVTISEPDRRDSAMNMNVKEFDDKLIEDKILDAKRLGLNHYRVKNRTDRNLDKNILKTLLYKTYGKTIP